MLVFVLALKLKNVITETITNTSTGLPTDVVTQLDDVNVLTRFIVLTINW